MWDNTVCIRCVDYGRTSRLATRIEIRHIDKIKLCWSVGWRMNFLLVGVQYDPKEVGISPSRRDEDGEKIEHLREPQCTMNMRRYIGFDDHSEIAWRHHIH